MGDGAHPLHGLWSWGHAETTRTTSIAAMNEALWALGVAETEGRQAAADELHAHKQTLGYRIRKIEHLTGRRLKSTRDIGELWFAVRAYDLTQGRSTDEHY